MRPDWDDYFLKLLEPLSARATCGRGRSSAIAVSHDHHMLSTGYVGAPRGMPHCDDVGHLIVTWVVDHDSSDDMNGEHCVRTLHAEQNVICEAAKLGIALRGSTFYTTMVPCYSCAMLMTAVGVLRVVSLHPYQSGSAAEKLFRQVGISLVVKENRELY